MSKRIKFYTDEHVPNAVVKGLRLRGIDVLTTKEANRLGATDEEHLAFANKEGRIIFTQDGDFLRLNTKRFEHSGIAGRIGVRSCFLIFHEDSLGLILNIEYTRIKQVDIKVILPVR